MTTEASLLSRRAKALRQRQGWSIAETARRAGLSASALWKVEQAQTTLTYGRIARLAQALDVPVDELFADPPPFELAAGRRVRRRHLEDAAFTCEHSYRFLAHDISPRHFSSCLVDICAEEVEVTAQSHAGEEFSFVLSGEIRFQCEGYAPVVLHPGDSVYFDAILSHRYIQEGGVPARMLCFCSHPHHPPARAPGPLPMTGGAEAAEHG